MPWVTQKSATRATYLKLLPILAVTSILAAAGLIWIYTRLDAPPAIAPAKITAALQPAPLIPTAAPAPVATSPTARAQFAKAVSADRVTEQPTIPVVTAASEVVTPTYAWSLPPREWSPPSYQVVRSQSGMSPATRGTMVFAPSPLQPTTTLAASAWGTPPTVSPVTPPAAGYFQPQLARMSGPREMVSVATAPTGAVPARQGTAEPQVVGVNVTGNQGFDIGLIVGANRLYTAGYTGTNARVANIEGGTAWRGHQTLDWMTQNNNIFWSTNALNETANPSPQANSQNTSMADHATSTSMNIAGREPVGVTTNLSLYRGIAYGIADGNFYSGNMASFIGTGTQAGSFGFSFPDLREIYYRAIVEGVGAGNTTNSANRVDVVSSSWGNTENNNFIQTNLNIRSKITDGVLYEGNQTRGSTSVISAGNSGALGVNTVGSPASGFNSIAVAALGEFATDLPSGSVFGTPVYNVATAFSSRGPIRYNQPANATDEFGTSQGNVRARVDIAAPGFQMNLATYTYSATNPDGSSPTAYSIIQGTSFSAPTVAGGIALLADYAHSPEGPADPTFATDGRVMKAVIINSATKTAGWNNGQNWNGTQWSTTQGLDYVTGGGALNLDQAFNQYANVTGNTITQLINPTEAPSYNVLGTGWARTTITRPETSTTTNADFVLSGSLTKHTEINTTLNWFVNRTSAANGTAADVAFHNLDLEVWRTDGNGNAVTRVGQSTSNSNNTEHLSFLVPEDGQYLVRVIRPGGSAGTYYSFGESDASLNTDTFGLAWMSRPSFVANNFADIISGTPTYANVLVAPDTNGGELIVSGSGVRVNALNRVLVGGTDRGAAGSGINGVLSVAGGATLNASNQLRVFSGSTLDVANGTVTGGLLTLDSGATFTSRGNSVLQFSTINASAPIAVGINSNVTFQSFFNSSSVISGRLNLLNAAGSVIDVGTGSTLELHHLITGSNGLTKNGTGTLRFRIPWSFSGSKPHLYTGTTQINAGVLELGFGEIGLPTNGNVVVESGATFRINTGSTLNSTATAIGTLTLNSGNFAVPTGSSDYYLNRLVMTGGNVNFTGSSNFWLNFVNSGAEIVTNASSSTATWTGGGTSRILNDTASPLTITVADGAADIDLNAGIILSNLGTNDTFNKAGAGTMVLGNTANSANFVVQAGRLRVDQTNLGGLGSGMLSLNGGTLTYGNTTNNGSTSKAISVGSSGGTIEVPTASRTLTANGALSYNSATLNKSGPGTLIVNATATGNATSVLSVNAGTVQLADSANLPNSGTVRLNGGTLSTSGVTTNYSDTVGNLQIAANSTLALGSNPHSLTFTGITGTPTGTLSITGWVGTPSQSGDAGDLLFTNVGSTPNTTYSDFLDSVQFQDYALGEASFLLISGSTFELVLAPVPEPGAVLAIAASAFAVGSWIRRRRATRTEPCINSKA